MLSIDDDVGGIGLGSAAKIFYDAVCDCEFLITGVGMLLRPATAPTVLALWRGWLRRWLYLQ